MAWQICQNYAYISKFQWEKMINIYNAFSMRKTHSGLQTKSTIQRLHVSNKYQLVHSEVNDHKREKQWGEALDPTVVSALGDW